MAFIGEYWYIWLAIMLAGYGVAVYGHINRVKKINSSIWDGNPHEGTGKLIVAQVIGALGMLLLFIAIVVNIIDYAR